MITSMRSEAAHTHDKEKRRRILGVVVRQRLALLELLPRADQAQLIGRDARLLPGLGLGPVARVVRFDLERGRLARQRLDEGWRVKTSRCEPSFLPSCGRT